MGRKLRIGMEFYIDYAHHLPGHDICGKPHGHTAKIDIQFEANSNITHRINREVTIKNYEESMVIDFRDIKREVNDTLNLYDHKDLNEFFNYPSSEVVAMAIYENLLRKFSQTEECHLYSVRFYEGNGKYVEIVNI